MSDQFAYKRSKQLQINELEHEVKTVDGRAAEAHARLDAVVQRVVKVEQRLAGGNTSDRVTIFDVADQVTVLFGELNGVRDRLTALAEGNDSHRIDNLTTIIGEFGGRLTALESTVDALKHVRMTDIDRVTALYNRVTALESAPRSEPVRDDPMCDECGHRRSCHSDGHGCGFGQCYCREFVAPTPEAATADQVRGLDLNVLCETCQHENGDHYRTRNKCAIPGCTCLWFVAPTPESAPAPVDSVHGRAWSMVRSRLTFLEGPTLSIAQTDALASAIVDDVFGLVVGDPS